MNTLIKTKLITIAISFVISIFSTTLFAYERSVDEINNVAINVATQLNPNRQFSIDRQSMAQKSDIENNKAYKIIKLKPKGWVVVSKDDAYTPVIGYNLKSNFNNKIVSLSFIAWMKNVNHDIEAAKENNIQDKKILAQWESLAEEPEAFAEELLDSNKSMHIYADYHYFNWEGDGKNVHMYVSKSFRLASLGILKFNQKGTNITMTVSWLKNDASKVYLYIYDYGHKKVLYRGYRYDNTGSKTFKNVSANGKIRIYLASYIGNTRHGYINTYTCFKRAHILTPKDNQKLKNTNMTVKWAMNASPKAILSIANITHYKNLYTGSVKGTSKTITNLPKNGDKIRICLNSCNGNHCIYVTAMKERAKIISPVNNTRLTSTNMLVKWKKNNASKVRVRVYDYKTHKNFYSAYTTGNSIVMKNLPSHAGKMALIVYSYDAKNKYMGYDRRYIYAKFARALITSPKNYTKLKSTSMKVTWEKNRASKVKIRIYDYKKHKYIYFSKYLTGTSTVIKNLPTHGGRMALMLFSYDANNKYLGFGFDRLNVYAMKGK